MYRIFNLISVPPDEEAAMREALDRAHVLYYDTPRGEALTGSPGLWAESAEEAERGKAVIERAQIAWTERARAERGPVKTWDWRNPAVFGLILIILMVVVASVIAPLL